MTKVLANGCFDPFHIGHLLYLQEARKWGTTLIVSVTEDAFVNKGPDRPYQPLEVRMAVLRALAIVDSVISTPNAEAAITRVKPHFYVKHAEYKNNLPEKSLVESYGGRVVFADTKKYSSTLLISRAGSAIPRSGSGGLDHR